LLYEKWRFADDCMIHASVDGFGFGFVVGKTEDAFGKCFAKVERGKKILELGFLLTKNWVPLSPLETFWLRF
jgi:hypothetical protein